MQADTIQKTQGWTITLRKMPIGELKLFPGSDHSTIRALISGRFKKHYPEKVFETKLKTVPVPGQDITVQMLEVVRTK